MKLIKFITYFLTLLIGASIPVLYIFFSVDSEPQTWVYELPNNYEVSGENLEKVVVKKVENGNVPESIVIPAFVKEFSYDERYAFTRNTDDIENNNVIEDTYYILDTEKRTVYGPLETVEELEGKAKEIQVIIPDKWYRTSSDPNVRANRDGSF